jgi:amidase
MEGSELMPINIVHQGMLSRTVRDTAAFYAGAETVERNSSLPEIGLVTGPGKKRLKIGMFTITPFGTPCHSETESEVKRIGALCEELGHSVQEITMPMDAHMADDFLIYWGMLAFSLRNYGRFMLHPGFDKEKTDNWTLGLSKLYQKNLFKTPFIIGRLMKQGRQFNEIFKTLDVVLSPTLAHPTPEIGYIGPDVPFEDALDRVLKFASFTPAQNVSGAPAISLPLGKSTNGMPMGIQFGAGPGMERTLLELAYELEEAQPWPLIRDSK